MKKAKIKILDCTLRDGGYYVNWDFDDYIVKKYIKSIAEANINITEIGFRFFSKNKFMGAHAYSSDEYIESLKISKKIQIAVMINASELLNYSGGIKKGIKKLFSKKINSPVDIVRIAAHARDIVLCKPIVNSLHRLGYKVCFNIMQIDSLNHDDLSKLISVISSWKKVDVLYFADSFGSMSNIEVKETLKLFKKNWNFDIGFHAHNNKGQALSNCIEAINNGADYLDSTILGMGRGAGNVQTENLLFEINSYMHNSYKVDPLISLSMVEFNDLKKKYHWGPNIYYYLSAAYRIHPTFIQELLSDPRYTPSNIITAINSLKDINANSYSKNLMEKVLSNNNLNSKGSWSAKNFCKNKNVLIVGNGPSLRRYLSHIKDFIIKNKIFVICLNYNDLLPSKLISAYAICNEMRVSIEKNRFNKINKPIVLPKSLLLKAIGNTLNEKIILDYGLSIEKNSFEINQFGCKLSNPLALPYAISFAKFGGANKILLAGIDGYSPTDRRQPELIKSIELYFQFFDKPELISITPTNLPLNCSSVFDPNLNTKS